MWLILVAIGIVITAALITLQFPRVQTAVARLVVDKVSDKIDGEISFEKIHLKPFTTLILKNTVILDKEPVTDLADSLSVPMDTLFRAEYIIAKFSFESLLGHEGVHIDKIYLTGAKMNLVIEDVPEADSDTTTVNLARIFHLKANPDKQISEKEIFLIRKAEIRDMEFVMKNYSARKPPYHGGINWNDMDVLDIGIKARNLRFKGGVMDGSADIISFREKSGFVCKSISSPDVKVGNGRTIIEDLKLDDGISEIKLPLFMMSYTCPKDFGDFIQKVRIDGKIGKSTLDFRTLWYFAPQLEGNRLRLAISGEASGYVEDFNLKDIKVTSVAGGFSGSVSGNMKGLPDINATRLDMKIQDFHFTAMGMGDFISEWMHEGRLDLDNYAKGTIFMLNGDVEGLLNRLRVNADINSMSGRLRAGATIRNVANPGKPIGIHAGLSTTNLDLGSIIGTDIIRQTTLRTGLDAVLEKDGTQVHIDSLIVDRLHLNGYDYSGIAAAGDLTKDSFNGKIICNDPSLNFLIQGTFALSAKTRNTLYRFYANIGQADLYAMNIDKRGKSKIRLQTNANFTRTANGQMLGKIDVGGIVLENRLGKHEVGDINITSHSSDGLYRMKLNSKFADANFSGTASIAEFAKDVCNITLRKEIPAIFSDSTYTWNGNSYNAGIKFHDSIDLLAYILPGMYIADDTAINATVSKDGTFDMKLDSPRIAFKEQYMKEISASVSNRDGHFAGELSSTEASAASMVLNDNRFMFLLDENHIGAGYTYENKGELINRGEFFLHSDLRRVDDEVEMALGILPSTLYLNSKEWNIQSSRVTVRGREIDVPSIELSSGEEAVRISGSTSDTRRDTLTLSLDRFDISVLNSLAGSEFGFKGALTGNVRLTSPLTEKGLLADLICDSTFIAQVPLGVLHIGSKWDESFRRFDIGLRNDLDGKSSIDLRGNYSPKHSILNLSGKFDRFNVAYAKPFLTDIFSEMEGYLSGDITVDGPVNSLALSSEGTRIDDARLKIAYTNVAYTASGPFHLDSEGVYFDGLEIADRFNGSGKVTGSINWDNFNDIRFDTSISVKDIECIDISEKDADVFYGQVFGSGKLHIGGPINSLQLNIDAATTKPGQLHIPISNISAGGGTTNLLKFTEPERFVKVDPYEEMMRKLKKQKTASGELGVRIHANATPDVEAFIEIDKASGNVLSGRGTGNIDLEVNNDIFSIKGDYRLTSGKYKFVAMGLVSRDFQIQDGSTVNFTGDIMDSRLDIDAVYRTKASLSTLISDTSSVSNRRAVECGISISDKISSPRIDFSINIPDLDPTVKARVESALSTDDKVQKQFLSLLITNNFLPDDQSGIVNNMYSNVGELMANQINNIFQKLDIPLDLGLNYQPNERGNDIFDVAISTQLFNNRVIVNGNIGNRQYTSGSSQSGVAGDIEIEIKLDRAGAFRLNLFSHSADQYTNYLDNTQRSGIGVTYQTEFNTFRQFFRNMFSSKAKRQEARLEEERYMLEGKKNVVSITADDDRVARRNRKR
ncbi:MAG: translocation/assembly module TamB domain-containing protein [Candidatus Cryptobacteroides sp.]